MLSASDTNVNSFNFFYRKNRLIFLWPSYYSYCERHESKLKSESTVYVYAFLTSAVNEVVGPASRSGL